MGEIDNLLAVTRKEPGCIYTYLFHVHDYSQEKGRELTALSPSIGGGQCAVNQDAERSSQATIWNSHFNIFLKKHRGELQNTTFRNDIPENPNRLNFQDVKKNHTILSRHRVI